MATTVRKKRPCRPICAPASAARQALGNRGPIRLHRFGRASSRDRRGLLALWLLRVRGRAEGRTSWPTSSATCTTSSIACRSRRARRSTPRAGRRSAADCSGPNLHWARPLSDPWGGTSAANGRHPVKMYEPATDGPAEGGRVPHPGLAAVLGGGAARLRPSRPARRRGRDQRAGLRAVQRGAVDQGARQGRLGRLAPGRHHPLGQPGLGRGHPRLQLHGPALRLHRRQRRVGRAGLAQAGQGRHQPGWPPMPAPSGCPTPCRSSARRATSR